MADVVLVMYADLGAPLPTVVFASDAMGANEDDHGGFGIVAAQCERTDVNRCFEEGLDPGFAVCRLDGSTAGLKRPERQIARTIPFTRVPNAVVEASWRPILAGRWHAPDHITLGEGRAVVKLLDIITRDPRCHRTRMLSLQDNRPIAGSFGKGRSTAPALNRLCRQRAAYCLAGEVQLLLPWVQSALMPADWLSRQIDNAGASEPREAREAIAHPARRPQG